MRWLIIILFLLSPLALAQQPPTRVELLRQRDDAWQQSHIARNRGQSQEGIAPAGNVVALDRQLFGDMSPEVGQALDWLATLEEDVKDYAHAVASRRDALAVWTRLPDIAPWQSKDEQAALRFDERMAAFTPREMRQMAEATRLAGQSGRFMNAGKLLDALDCVQRAMAIRLELFGRDNVELAKDQRQLSNVLSRLQDYAGAEAATRRAMELDRAALGEDHPDYRGNCQTLASILESEARLAIDLTDFDAARQKRREVVTLDIVVYGADSGAVIDARRSLEFVEKLARRDQKHLSLYRQAADLQNRRDELSSENRLPEAIKAAEKCAQLYKQVLGDDEEVCWNAVQAWANLCDRAGDTAVADKLLDEQLGLRRKYVGENHASYQVALELMLERQGQAAERRGDFAAARDVWQRILDMRRKAVGETYWQTIDAAINVQQLSDLTAMDPQRRQYTVETEKLEQEGQALARQGNVREAIGKLESALARYRETLPADDIRIANACYSLGNLYRQKGDAATAVDRFREATNIRNRKLGTEHGAYRDAAEHLAESLEQLAGVLQDQAKFDTARKAGREAQVIYDWLYGDRDWRVRRSQLSLAYVDTLERIGETGRKRLAEADQLREQSRKAPKSDIAVTADLPAAAKSLEKAISIHREVAGEDAGYAQWMRELGDLRERMYDYPGATVALRASAAIYRRLAGEDYPAYLSVREEMIVPLRYEERVASERDDWPAEAALRQELLEIQTLLHGARSWQASDEGLALEMARKIMAFDAPQKERFAKSQEIDQQVKKLRLARKSAEAIPLAWQTAKLRAGLFGETPDYADDVEEIGRIYDDADQPAAAQWAREQALAVRLRVLGPWHPDYLKTLVDQQGRLCAESIEKEDYPRARQACRQMLMYRLRWLGPSDWHYVQDRYILEQIDVLANLDVDGRRDLRQADEDMRSAGALLLQHRLADSLDLLKRAARLRAERVGVETPLYADCLLRQAELYMDLGDYPPAETALENASRIYYQWYGERSPAYANALQELGACYVMRGDLDRGQQTLQQAVMLLTSLMADAVQSREVDAAASAWVNGLSGLVDATMSRIDDTTDPARRKAAAGELLPLMRLITGQLNKLDENAPPHLQFYAELGELYLLTGDIPHARETLQASIDKAKAFYGPSHPYYAGTLDEYTLAQAADGQYEAALAKCREAGAIYRQTMPGSLDMAGNLRYQARLEAALGHRQAAFDLQRQSMEIEEANLQRAFALSAEPRMRSYLDVVRSSLETLLSLTPGVRDQKSEVGGQQIEQAMDWVLKRQGMLLSSLVRLRAAQELAAGDQAVSQRAEQLRDLRLRLADMALQPPKGVPPADLQRLAAQMRDEADRVEAELNQQLATTRPAQAAEVSVKSVREHLPKGGALVQIVRSRIANFTARPDQSYWAPAHYFAFILAAKDAPPEMIDLGLADAIDAQVAALRSAITSFDPDNQSEKEAEQKYRTAADALYQSVFAPLRPKLGDAKVICISPDGELNRVPFEALTHGDKYLIEEGYEFAYLSSGQDLLRPQAPLAQGTVVFADPDFDLKGPEQAKEANALLAALPHKHEIRMRSYRGSILSRRHFEPLEHTLKEATAITGELKDSAYGPVAAPYKGKGALKQVLLAIAAPRILHIATHGFFEADAPAGPLAGNPLLRSGLALAGANAPDETTGDDGLVTAQDVAMMNLQGTELVVLSACESGLGEVKTGEGVLGLRRAFLSAGARSLVVSLYRIPDDSTQQLMASFYHSLKTGHGKLASLHAAELQMLQSRRKAGGAAHPLYWAGFVLVGEL